MSDVSEQVEPERRYTLSLSWDQVAFLQSVLGACQDIAINFREPELAPFAESVVQAVDNLAKQAREDHYPNPPHTLDCACQLCIEAFGPVGLR